MGAHDRLLIFLEYSGRRAVVAGGGDGNGTVTVL